MDDLLEISNNSGNTINTDMKNVMDDSYEIMEVDCRDDEAHYEDWVDEQLESMMNNSEANIEGKIIDFIGTNKLVKNLI